jgi:hypothetical protein
VRSRVIDAGRTKDVGTPRESAFGMSKNNNVNPGQYKVAGRERPGEDVVTAEHKARLTQAQPEKKRTVPPRATTSRVAKKATR